MNDGLPTHVRVVEVGPRDGLQNEKDQVPVEAKVAFIDALSRSGLREIEVTSFVNPRSVSQLADAEDVLNRIEKREVMRFSVLIPNLKGLERWLACAGQFQPRARAIALFTAASETFNQRNINASIAESLENFRSVIDRLRKEFGEETPFVRGYVSTAFRCPYEGVIAPEKVAHVAAELLDLGVNEISLGDTIGSATPRDVDALLDRMIPAVPIERLAMHFHDTRGTALANVLASMARGVRIFDSSAGGLGGCPFAPGASGNLATEDLLYMLNGMNIATGIDLTVIAEASNLIRPFIGHELPSKELQALNSTGF